MKNINLRRFVAYIIDLILVGVVASCLSMIPVLGPEEDIYDAAYEEILSLYDQFEKNEISESDYEEKYISLSYDLNQSNKNYTIINVVLLIFYFGLFPYFMNGQTLGKKLMKLQVVSNEQNGKVGIFSYLVRAIILNNVLITIAQIIVLSVLPKDQFYPIYSNINLVGYILIYIMVFLVLVRKDYRGLHDLIAGTKVVLVSSDEEVEEQKESVVEENVKVEKKEEVVEEANFEEVKKEKTKKSTKSKK